MKHEKIITRQNRIQYQIVINFWFDILDSVPVWDVTLEKRFVGVKTWAPVEPLLINVGDVESIDNTYMDNILQFVTKEEIKQAKLELWEKLKPQ